MTWPENCADCSQPRVLPAFESLTECRISFAIDGNTPAIVIPIKNRRTASCHQLVTIDWGNTTIPLSNRQPVTTRHPPMRSANAPIRASEGLAGFIATATQRAKDVPPALRGSDVVRVDQGHLTGKDCGPNLRLRCPVRRQLLADSVTTRDWFVGDLQKP
jgi:hypothetical protein